MKSNIDSIEDKKRGEFMRTKAELLDYLSGLENPPQDYKIAVASLIFADEGKVILLERGQEARDEKRKYEGVGGGLDDEHDLYVALYKEIGEEIGSVKVDIDELLTVMILPNMDDSNKKWVIPVYLCRLVEGKPEIMEPHKCAAIHQMTLEEIPEDKLSIFQKTTMDAYREKYGNKPYYLEN